MVLFGPSISKGGVFTKYEIRVKYYDTTNHAFAGRGPASS